MTPITDPAPRSTLLAVPIREQGRDGNLLLPGEATPIPELAIVPGLTRDPLRHCYRFTGEWGLVHTPTRTIILLAECEPFHLRAMVDHIASQRLDWSTFDVEQHTRREGPHYPAVLSAYRSTFATDPSACEVPVTNRWGADIQRAALPQAAQNFDQYQRAFDLIITPDPLTGKPRLDDMLPGGGRNPLHAEAMATMVSSMSIGYLLAAFHRIDPDAADSAAASLADMLDEGSSIGSMVHRWRHQIADGDPLALPGVPPPVRVDVVGIGVSGTAEAGGPGA